MDCIKDMIIFGGMNVYLVEVEVVIRKDLCVLDVVVFGVLYLDWGEEVWVVVVVDFDFDIENYFFLFKDELFVYKVLKKIYIMFDFFFIIYGKINKKLL